MVLRWVKKNSGTLLILMTEFSEVFMKANDCLILENCFKIKIKIKILFYA